MLKLANAPFGNAWHPIGYLLLTAAAGAVGAVLSIALSVRARTVATDGDSSSISMDALLRVSIGIISAGVLYLVLNTGVIAQLRIGDLGFKPGAVAWQLALLAGFAAGFLERLVPDLLEKKAA